MYAITRNSRRARGQAVACDLVRVALRGANLLSAKRHNEAMYSRLAEDFGGYLVTEREPMTEAEILATDGGRHCAPGFGAFSDSRGGYAPRRVSVMGTGFQFYGEGGPLDAPEWIAAGAQRWIEGFGAFPVAVDRGALL